MKRRAVPTALALTLAGCAAPLRVDVDPALFPRGTAATSASPIALVVSPQVLAREDASRDAGTPGRSLMLPTGRVVAAAVRSALDDRLGGRGAGAVVAIEAVHFAFDIELLWILPLGPVPISQSEPVGELAFDAALNDARGTRVWSRHYDTGRQTWKLPWQRGEQGTRAVVQQAHEAAWRLAQNLARDVGDWLDAERLRPREL